MVKTEHITMRVDKPLHSYLVRMAEREDRPLSNMIFTLLLTAAKRDGYKPPVVKR